MACVKGLARASEAVGDEAGREGDWRCAGGSGDRTRADGEESDLLRLAVVEHRKVVFGQAGYGFVVICDDDVDLDQLRARAEGRGLGSGDSG